MRAFQKLFTASFASRIRPLVAWEMALGSPEARGRSSSPVNMLTRRICSASELIRLSTPDGHWTIAAVRSACASTVTPGGVAAPSFVA